MDAFLRVRIWVVRFVRPLFVAVSVLVAMAAAPRPALVDDRIVGPATVVDGDTIEIGDQRIHLYGIDAPEFRQTCRIADKSYACGEEAAFALADEIGQRPLVCDPVDTNSFGRVIAVCWLETEDVNARMVSLGWALAHRRASQAYAANEDEARTAQRGLWRGQFDPPWEWRAARRRPRTAREI
jgi:endonuclease YncB( thermonuclease family)